jgi:parallel beta-helix repeat protein
MGHRAAAQHRSPVVFYVAPEGDDRWSGTLPAANAQRGDGPFATVQRARDAIRRLKRRARGLEHPVTVHLREGIHFLGQPLVLTAQDSGTAECPITYAAYPGERPVLSGGRPIADWRRTRINGRPAWAADLPEVAQGEWYFRQLFVNDDRRPRTRLPREGFYRFTGLPNPPEETPSWQGQTEAPFAPGDLRRWRNLRDVEITALHQWMDSHLPIARVNEQRRIVTFACPSIRRLTEKRDLSTTARYYVQNVREALDTPGQWYLDRRRGTLYYLPPPGEDPRRACVVAPRLAQAVRFEGDARRQRWVEYVELRGLTFSHTEWSLPPESAGFNQAAFGVPGAVVMEGARRCALRECTVAHIGNYAVEVGAGCEGNAIERCAMFDLGAGGVKLGPGSARTTVADCDIGDGGHIFHAAIGVWVGDSGHNRVIHNHVHGLDYTGISVGWTWGYGSSAAVANRIEHNHIHDIGRGMLSDLGSIYMLGVSPGTVVRHNLIHDCFSATDGGWGIYLDEGSSRIVVEGNLVFRTKSGGFHQHYGRDNIIRNNIFALGKEMQVTRSREEEHHSFTFERNIVYWNQGDLLASFWKNGNFALDHNVYYDASGRPFTFDGLSLEQWRERGFDAHSLIADPKFADPAKGDFALADDSPAFALGFQRIDLSAVGPRGGRRP